MCTTITIFTAAVTYEAPTLCQAQSTTRNCYSYQMRKRRLREGEGFGQEDTASEDPSNAWCKDALHPFSPQPSSCPGLGRVAQAPGLTRALCRAPCCSPGLGARSPHGGRSRGL